MGRPSKRQLELGPDLTKFQKVIPELSESRSGSFLRFAQSDLKEIASYPRWLQEQERKIAKLIAGLEKKQRKLKEPFILARVSIVLNGLEKVRVDLSQILKEFKSSIEGNKKFILSLEADPKIRASAEKDVDPNKDLYLLSQAYDGVANLYKELNQNPSLKPIGIKEDLTLDAIRKRVKRYEKKILPRKK